MNKLIEKGAIRFRNHIDVKDDNTVKLSVHCAGNDVFVRGEKSILRIIAEGYLRNSKCSIEGKGNSVVIEDNSKIVGDCRIRVIGNNNSIEIKNNCEFTECSIFIIGNDNNLKIGESVSAVLTSYHMEGDDNRIEIGHKTSFHGRSYGMIELSLEEATSIYVGNDCMISNGVSFRSSDSHSILNEKGERINPAGNITIKDHVWIGMRSIVLKNSIIHDNCIIGAGSVCNKDYEKDNCLIAGNPAKIVKENVNWSRDRL